MGAIAPGRCAGCGADAYIQLAGEAAMLCARCYAKRKDLGGMTARKGGEREGPMALRRSG
jgi:hypothetical protein